MDSVTSKLIGVISDTHEPNTIDIGLFDPRFNAKVGGGTMLAQTNPIYVRLRLELTSSNKDF
jgi:hypothetical protein